MRDIKFRAWNDIDKSYIDWMTLCGMPKLITNIARGKEKHYQLEQYTGLKDKKGVEIFEGDMFFDGIENCTIEWCDESASFVANDGTEKHTLGSWVQHEMIIGNIHQNPELIGE